MITKRIAGRYLAQHIGDEVILLGTINRKSSNGKNVELRTVDGTQVNVTLAETLNGDLEDYIEVYGTVQSKGTMSCRSYIHFPPAKTQKFNANQYNDCLAVLNVLGTKAWSISEDDTD